MDPLSPLERGLLVEALAGGPPLRLDAPDGAQRPVAPAGTAVVVRTSGSTSGTGRAVALSSRALLHSARATHERLEGPGQWLLALPARHIAGLQVLIRSHVAGTEPVALEPGPFRPEALAAAIGAMRTDVPRYLSLVPTQLHRVLDGPAPALQAVASCAAILVGGSALRPALRTRARAAGLPVIGTYGMTETCGGCVYDGHALPGVQVALEQGRVLLSGPVLASGYLDAGPDPFVIRDGRRWLATSDAGTLHEGRLEVTGRIDDVILTGGVNVHPGPIERALASLTGVAEICVVGVPDEQWGQVVTAVLQAPDDAGAHLERVRALVKGSLGAGAHVPRAVVVVDRLPLLGPGKVDRAATARIAAQALGSGRGQRY